MELQYIFNLNNFQKSYLRELVFNEIEKLTKRNKIIVNLKSYQNKIISNLRDNDFLSYKKELSINDNNIIFLNKLLEVLKWQ